MIATIVMISGVVTRRKAAEYLIDTSLTDYQWMCVQNDWKAFADDPLKYADTAVVYMIKDYVLHIL